MSDVFEEFEFNEGDEKVETRQSKFTLQAKQPELISMAWIRGIESGDFDPKDVDSHGTSPRFIRCFTVYIKGVGKIIIPKDDAEVKALVDKHATEDVRLRVATVIVKWPSMKDDKDKLVLDTTKIKAGKFEVYPWEFAAGKYNMIKDQGSENPLLKSTLRVSLVGDKKENFQDFAVISRAGGVLRKIFESDKQVALRDKLVAAIRDCIKTLTDTKLSVLGKRLTAKEIRQKLSSSDGDSDSDVGDGVADEAADIDDMLDDL